MNSPEFYYSLRESVFIIVGVIGLLIYRLLIWLMPKTWAVFLTGIIQMSKKAVAPMIQEELKSLREDINNFKEESKRENEKLQDLIVLYKFRKHYIQGEYDQLKSFINDEALSIEEVREMIKDSKSPDDILLNEQLDELIKKNENDNN